MSAFQGAGFSRSILMIILLNLTALISAGNDALAYYAAGNVDLYIRNSMLEDPVHYRDSDNEGLGLTESSVYLSVTAPSSLNYAWGESYASLATGTLSASAYAKTISDTGYDTFAVASPILQDTIYFYVPAGYYASGVKASLIGQVDGTLFASSSGKGARAYVQAT
ncbi:MAG: hypothetical protein OEU95_05670, partial [Nitrospirota bacterium]|nr:hypothetical protein [Nitrospirota bacterium]